MRIHVQRSQRKGYKWQADIIDLPGSPCCGFGKTKEEAVAGVFRMNLGVHGGCFTEHLVELSKTDKPVEITYE